MKRLFTYVSETGGLPILGTIEAPPHSFKSLRDVFEQILEHECLITQHINELAHVAFSSQDYSTFNFLQWYVAEQHEEEKLFKGVLDKLTLVGNDGPAMFLIDKDFAALANDGGGSIMAPWINSYIRNFRLSPASLPAGYLPSIVYIPKLFLGSNSVKFLVS